MATSETRGVHLMAAAALVSAEGHVVARSGTPVRHFVPLLTSETPHQTNTRGSQCPLHSPLNAKPNVTEAADGPKACNQNYFRMINGILL